MNEIKLYQLKEEDIKDISYELNNDSEVNKYVKFYNKKGNIGIFYNSQLIGLFNLNKFIGNNLTIHIALIKQFRNRGIGRLIFNEIIETYGSDYPDVELFLANIDYRNKRALNSLEKAGWTQTHSYDEVMINEGAEFFIIYEKQNPYYRRKVMSYDSK